MNEEANTEPSRIIGGAVVRSCGVVDQLINLLDDGPGPWPTAKLLSRTITPPPPRRVIPLALHTPNGHRSH